MLVWNIPYTISEQDYLDFNDHYLRKTSSGKKFLLKKCLISVLAVFIVLPLVFIMDTDVSVKCIQIAGLAVIALSGCFLNIPLFYYSTKRAVKKMRKPGENLYSKCGHLVFDFENGIITDIGETVEVKVHFQNIMTCYETNTAFYFYFSNHQAIMMPYRIFKSQEEFCDFQKLVRQTFPVEKHNVFQYDENSC